MWVLPAPGLLGDSTNSCDDSPGYVTMETVGSALSPLLFSGFVSIWGTCPPPPDRLIVL